jgi:predicted dehydrogenase
MGMIGGGPGAFIGQVHRIAAAMDGQIELVCGAFSSDAAKSRETGIELMLPEDRVYPDYKTMIEKERELAEGERMDFVSIVTPNHVHFEPAALALENGFHVMLDKPIAFSLTEAKNLKALVASTGLLLGLTHTYTGYPMVKEARELIKSGVFGEIRKAYVEYPQGWLSSRLEATDQKQAAWRTDPNRSGKGGASGDIGTHAENMIEYVTGLHITEMCGGVQTFVEGRPIDDDCEILIRMENGATGSLFATQVAAGEENNIKFRVYGEKGGVEWQQEDNNSLKVMWLDKPAEIYRAGGNNEYLTEHTRMHCRTPAGHPEGYLEAFANIYRNFAMVIRARLNGEEVDPHYLDYPGAEEGVRGMAFVETVVEAAQNPNKWINVE